MDEERIRDFARKVDAQSKREMEYDHEDEENIAEGMCLAAVLLLTDDELLQFEKYLEEEK